MFGIRVIIHKYIHMAYPHISKTIYSRFLFVFVLSVFMVSPQFGAVHALYAEGTTDPVVTTVSDTVDNSTETVVTQEETTTSSDTTEKFGGCAVSTIDYPSDSDKGGIHCGPVYPTVTLTATPDTINNGQSSTLTWNATQAKFCSANWTTSVDVSGTEIVSPSETTVYKIFCTNNPGEKTEAHVTVTVVTGGQCLVPVISSPLTASGTVNSAFSYTLTASSTGATTSGITYSISTTTLPAGLTATETTISGTPTTAGTYTVALSATNQCGVSNKDLIITVASAPTTCENPVTQSGWLAQYYDLPLNHPDTERAFSQDTSHGNPLSPTWTGDWYTSKYFAFSRVDSNLVFGDNFYPLDATTPQSQFINGHNYHFAISWKATVTVPTAGNYEYTLTSDDDAWVYVNGVLVVDNSGLHPAQTKTGTIYLTKTSTVEVFYAERQTDEASMTFKFLSHDVVVQVPTTTQCVPNTAPVITLIGANPFTITAGTLFVDPGATAQDAEDGTITSSIVVSGTVGTTTGSYTLTYSVSDSKGLSATPVTRTVVVSAPTLPVVTLTATPDTINNGESSTLTWTATNAKFCSANWTTSTDITGTQVVSPNQTTVYKITCTNNPGEKTEAQATVTVRTGGGGNNSVTATLTASPSTITPGSTSTLSWTSTNASQCSALWTTATSTTGSFVVNPTSTTAYTITCSNSSQSASSTATVTVAPNTGGGNSVTTTISANPSTIAPGQSTTLSWTSTNATSCSAVWTTASSTSGTFVISPNGTTDYAINCTNGTASFTATTTVTVSTPNNGGGTTSGGGTTTGGGRSSTRRSIGGGLPQILGAETSCSYLRDYMKIGWNNDRTEVIKLQVFLKIIGGFSNLEVTGIFDQATYVAVSAFQDQYKGDILTPWGHTAPTGYVYILTKKKVNEIFCNKAFPLNIQQEQEIRDFKMFMSTLSTNGVYIPGLTTTNSQGQILSTNTTVPVNFAGSVTKNVNIAKGKKATSSATSSIVKAEVVKKGIFSSGIFSNPEWRNIAAAVFAQPKGLEESSRVVIAFFIILLVIYSITQYIVDRQNKLNTLSQESVNLRKVFYFVLGLVLFVLGALYTQNYKLVLPLLVLIVILSIIALWLSLKKKEVRTLVKIQ